MARVACLGTVLFALGAVGAADAGASSYLPPSEKRYHGVSDTGRVSDFKAFRRQVTAHPAVLQEFFHWDVSFSASGAVSRWKRTRTLGVVSLSTDKPANGRPDISPQAIAKGRADHYLLRINEVLGGLHRPSYIRLMPEMNGHWNPYSAYKASGAPRGPRYTTHDFKRAWRRIVLIVRGGPRADVNRALRNNGLPRIYRANGEQDPVYRRRDVPKILDRPEVAFMWVPQSFGSPNISGNQPADYWPGPQFVDWVGVDIFAKFASAFDDMQDFYARYDDHPFVIGEYSPWDNDFSGNFTDRLLSWAESHARVRMLIYYRSVTRKNQYSLHRYDGAQRVLRRHLNKPTWKEYAPGLR